MESGWGSPDQLRLMAVHAHPDDESSKGAAIMGKKVGEKATYSLPNGRASTVEILDAVPYAGA